MSEEHSPTKKQLLADSCDKLYAYYYKISCRHYADENKRCSCQYRSCGDEDCLGDCGCLFCLNAIPCTCKCKCKKCREIIE